MGLFFHTQGDKATHRDKRKKRDLIALTARMHHDGLDAAAPVVSGFSIDIAQALNIHRQQEEEAKEFSDNFEMMKSRRTRGRGRAMSMAAALQRSHKKRVAGR